jgi:VIT1/CCC1 family predicted Fe2+/Mn2+ transporter
MSEPQPEYAPPPTQSLPPSTAPSRPPGRSCISQIFGFVGWIFTLILSVGLALAAVAALAYFVFGFTLQTPQQINGVPNELAELRAANDEANARVSDLQTQVALQGSAGSDTNEQLGDIDGRIGALQTQVALAEQQAGELQGLGQEMQTLGQELEQNIELAATLQAEARDDQVAIAVFSTVQAENTLRLSELQQKADRLTRFIERLGDIVGDTESDLATPTVGTPTASSTAGTPSAGTPTVTPTTGTPTATPTATP